MKTVNLELLPEEASLIIRFLEGVKEDYLKSGKESLAREAMEVLLSKFKNALLLSDKRIAKLMGVRK